MNRLSRGAIALTLIVAVSGCATANYRNQQDPFEGFNRTMFSFNDKVDRIAVKPAATVYKNVLPQFVQAGVGNFFGNLGDVWTAVNNLLQGKVEDGLNDFMRVAVNSTFGLAGLLDIGSEAGLQKHHQDFGQTLGFWGVGPGPYVVLPIFGSSTLRDSLATPIDIAGDPWNYKRPIVWRTAGTLLRGIDLRASLLDASSLVEDAAIDRYEFIRDAYLQRRQSKIDDGKGVPLKQNKSSDIDYVPPTENATVNDLTAPLANPQPAAKVLAPAGQLTVPGPLPVTTADNAPIPLSSDAPPKQLMVRVD